MSLWLGTFFYPPCFFLCLGLLLDAVCRVGLGGTKVKVEAVMSRARQRTSKFNKTPAAA